jgi:Ca2+-binding RTX toxin-like protein
VVDSTSDVVVENANEGIDEVRTSLAAYTLGANVENLTYTGTASFAGTGNTLDNVITGGVGDDSINGGAGNDTMAGGAGNDTYTVDAAGDVVIENANEGTDTVRTSLTSYTLGANLENLTYTGTAAFIGTGNALANVITGGAGADTLSGGDGDDTLTGAGSADFLDGGTGNDTMAGGTGSDIYIVDSIGDVVIENASGGTDEVRTTLASYALGANVENLRFIGTGDFTGIGNTLANAITGGAGNDTLDGGSGNDTMVGGAGNDTYMVDASGDVVTENANEGTDEVRTSLASYTLGANLENLTYTGTANFTGTGNTLDNIITGGVGNDSLNGGVGNDTMVGGAGNDTYTVDAAGDVVIENANEGTDTVRTTLASYSLGDNVENLTFIGTGGFVGAGNGLANVITGGTGADTLSGGDGDDTLNGGAGNDLLDGGAGNDTMVGGAGNDIYIVDSAGDVVTEGGSGGTDEVRTSLASYTLGANVEILTYTGTGNFTGIGNTLANTITGGAGDDLLDGGSGSDHLIGGAGNDTYVVNAAGDVVTENAGEGTDEVRTSLATYTLGANLENLTYTGSAAFTGTGNTLDNVISGGAGNDTLNGGAGNDTLIGGAGNDKMTGGTGDDTYVVDSVGDVVTEAANEGKDTVLTSLASYTLGANVENLVGTGAAQTLIGNTLANTISVGGVNDTLVGGGGYDAYNLGAGMGHAVVNNLASDGVTTASGQIDFGPGITDQSLWFKQSGNDLLIDLMGSTDSVTVAGWFGGNARAQVAAIVDTVDGLRVDAQVSQLVSAMAAYSTAHPGFDPTTATQVPNDPNLQAAVAAAWHT